MTLYPSCLFNRTEEAKQHLAHAKKVGLNFGRYPYHIVNLSVIMRPIVEVVDNAREKKLDIRLLGFEPSRSFPKNDKYINANKIEIWMLLGVIIHGRYIHIGAREEDKKTVRLDVISDRGRWIVEFYEFLDMLKSYILSRDGIAATVCDMIGNYSEKVRKNEPKYRTEPPVIGNFDLEWLSSDYMAQEPDLKKAIMHKIFGVDGVPETDPREVRFSANSIGHKDFELYIASDNWRSKNSEKVKRVSWAMLSDVVRSYLDNKIGGASCKILKASDFL